MTEKKKQEYNAPKVKVVSFVVERGFNNYPDSLGQNTFYVQDHTHMNQTQDVSTTWRTETGDWF